MGYLKRASLRDFNLRLVCEFGNPNPPQHCLMHIISGVAARAPIRYFEINILRKIGYRHMLFGTLHVEFENSCMKLLKVRVHARKAEKVGRGCAF